MAWTFTDSPATVPADAVRLYVGDIDGTEPLLSDATVAWLLATSSGNILVAAARAARLVMTSFARLVDQAAGDHKESLSQRFKAFSTLTVELEGQAGIGGGGPAGGGTIGAIVSPVVTGISRSEMEAAAQNVDRPGSGFIPFDDRDPNWDGAFLYDPA